MDDSTEQPAARPARTVDARSLRALAHPLRMRILEQLTDEGPATSARLSDRLGESTGTISWHLRHLAEHGYIEEEQGRGTKRERWWRAVREKRVVDSALLRADPQTAQALSLYHQQYLEQQFRRVAEALTVHPEGTWAGSGTLADWSDVRMTADQLKALNAELLAVIERHVPAADAPADPDARPVFIQLQSMPAKPKDTETR
ncbi:DNA-binding transcriptional ArsR family regulator [Kitasatospora sp. MAP12-15]|uniref:ArsR/SmtB family transcription factor n=1 Tax=unclassified Kitasatospora TaxID=2633591 RepID=UPI002472FB61|nr:helix-turn-helix domain-containing protein [Kitasatospora sp. MAP12-44]MDH6110432.1 DNA-binding transcriptional ArsR family regulator [Kitasatospora sp. MAP12-44]